MDMHTMASKQYQDHVFFDQTINCVGQWHWDCTVNGPLVPTTVVVSSLSHIVPYKTPVTPDFIWHWLFCSGGGLIGVDDCVKDGFVVAVDVSLSLVNPLVIEKQLLLLLLLLSLYWYLVVYVEAVVVE